MSEKIPTSEELRGKLLDAVLEDVVFDGWTQETLVTAAKRIGLDESDIAFSAPNGVTDLLETWGKRADTHTRNTIKAADLSELKFREKIAYGVRARITFYNGLREEARTAAQAAAAPWRADLGPRLLWEASDTIWSALGDKSTDGNWYSKRMVLSAVLGSTLSTWLAQEEDDDDQKVWDYLDDRIENVMQFEKLKAQAIEYKEKLPNPLDLLKYIPGQNPFNKS